MTAVEEENRPMDMDRPAPNTQTVEPSSEEQPITTDAPQKSAEAVVEEPAAPVALGERGHEVLDRWTRMAERHTGRESFKTGLVLPLLASLGHDVFDPSTVSPIEDDGGAHEGYLVQTENGDAFVVVLDEGDLPDDHKDDVVVRIRRDRALLSVRIAGDDEAMRWQGVADVGYSSRSAREALGLLGRSTYRKTQIADMATRVHQQHEDVQQVVRDVIANPGDGFLSDVRLRLAAMGHIDPVLLDERVAAITARLLAGPVAEQEEEGEEEPKRRDMSPMENRAMDIIREICAGHVAGSLIVPRPGKNYTGVLYQDNNRKTLARLHFAAASVKYIGIFVDGEETRHVITGPEDVRNYADGILARLRELDPSAFAD